MRKNQTYWSVAAGLLTVMLIAAAVTFFAHTTSAQAATRHYGPIASTSPDSGTCGNFWAIDTFERHFNVDVRPNPDGTYSVREEFKNGTFTTTGDGPSPGSCDPGHTATPDPHGVTGPMHGSFDIIVSGGTYNASATCATGCTTTAGFVATVFGASALYDVPTYDFHYNAANCGDWKNASPNRGGDHGDITCANP